MSEQQPQPAPKRDPNPTTHPQPTTPVPPPPPRRHNGATKTAAESPWMKTIEVAAYSGRHRDTVLLALKEYARTKGRSGLKGFQQNGAYATWRVHRDDVDRWIRGEPPARGTRRFEAVRSA